MNLNRISGNWKHLKGNIKEKWGKLTGNDISIREGRRDQILGKIQVSCGIKPEEAKHELRDWGVFK